VAGAAASLSNLPGAVRLFRDLLITLSNGTVALLEPATLVAPARNTANRPLFARAAVEGTTVRRPGALAHATMDLLPLWSSTSEPVPAEATCQPARRTLPTSRFRSFSV